MKIIETFDLDEFKKNELFNLWNNEYPEKLAYRNLTEFDDYLNTLNRLKHLLLIDNNDRINGWAFSFDRDNERWFAIILSRKQQGQGLGRKMLDELKLTEKELNGWVIDHNNDKKSNGKTYNSPLEFYRKCGFMALSDKRLELEKITAVKMKWTSEN